MKIHVDMSDRLYFGIEAFSNSAIKHLLKSPAHYQANLRKKFDSAALRIGKLVHAHILGKGDEVAVFRDGKTLSSKAGTLFMQQNPGKLVVTEDEQEKAVAIVEALPKSIKGIFKNTINEVAIIGDLESVDVKCKLDAYSEHTANIYDIKTADSLEKFVRDFYKHGYHTQAAFYSYLAEKAGLKVNTFNFLVLEKEDPYAHKLVTIDKEVAEDGLNDVWKALNIYRKCVKKSDWPGYDEKALIIKRPSWRK